MKDTGVPYRKNCLFIIELLFFCFMIFGLPCLFQLKQIRLLHFLVWTMPKLQNEHKSYINIIDIRPTAGLFYQYMIALILKGVNG